MIITEIEREGHEGWVGVDVDVENHETGGTIAEREQVPLLAPTSTIIPPSSSPPHSQFNSTSNLTITSLTPNELPSAPFTASSIILPSIHPLLLATPVLVFFLALSALLGIWAVYTLSQQAKRRRDFEAREYFFWSSGGNGKGRGRHHYHDDEEGGEGVRLAGGDSKQVGVGEEEEVEVADAIEKSGEMIEEEVRRLILSPVSSPSATRYYQQALGSPVSSPSSSRAESLWEFYGGECRNSGAGEGTSFLQLRTVGWQQDGQEEKQQEQPEEVPSPTRSLKGKERAWP